MSEMIAVHCRTEKEWEAVGVLFDSYNKEPLAAVDYHGTGAYRLSSRGFTIHEGHCHGKGYTIITASEYLREEEFKVGDRVEITKSMDGRNAIGEKGNITARHPGGTVPWVYQLDTQGGWNFRPDTLKLIKSTKQTNKPIKEESNMSEAMVSFEENIFNVFKSDPVMMVKVQARFKGQYATTDDRTLIALENDKDKLIAIIDKEDRAKAAAEKAAKK